MSSPAQIPVPADIDIADRVLFGLTVRQLLMLAPAGLAAALIWQSLGPVLPMQVVLVMVCLPVALCTGLAIGRIDGVGVDRLIAAAVTMTRRPLAAGRGTATGLQMTRVGTSIPNTGVLTGPVRSVAEDGIIDLGANGSARAIDVGHVNFDLLGGTEQTGLVAALARLCHGIEARLQITVATRPVDLSGYLDELTEHARTVPNAALAVSARAHAVWLDDLVRVQGLLDRQITIVVTARNAEAVEQGTVAVLDFAAAIGTAAAVLDRAAVCERVRAGIDPFGTAGRRLA